MTDFKSPKLFTVRSQERSLSNQALLSLLEAVLSKGFPFRFKAKGMSMSPFIRNGDVITITSFKQHGPRLGDVVAFKRPETGKLVIHRVVAIKGNRAYILGDSIPNKLDGIFELNELLGHVTCIKRGQKRIWFGLGPERILIAILSRTRLLIPLRVCLASLRNRFKSREVS